MSFFKKILFTAGLIAVAVLFYLWHQEQQNNRLLLNKIKAELQKDRASSASSSELHEVTGWGEVHEKSRNTVVQIFVHKADFNWVEPYKTPRQAGSTGTGFFIDQTGLIITNAHVVDQYRAVYIQIPHFGKRRFDVEVVGVSPDRDLALLRVIPEDLAVIVDGLQQLPVLEFGDSDTVRRADQIMALGFPLGQQSLKSTVGVVSGLQHIGGRSLIQIDAPINPGNSGGPSLNRSGAVVGVNSSGIFAKGTQNVGYIIPSNEVKLFLRQLDDTPDTGGVKFLRKPFLGVLYNTATDTLARYLGNPVQGGLYVVEVYKGSPLDKAGVQSGDMIYEIDGHEIDYFGEIQTRWCEDRLSVVDYVARLMPGDAIHMVIYRQGIRKELVAEFGFSDVTPVRTRYPGYETVDYEVIGGMVVMELTLNHLPIFIKENAQLSRFVQLDNQLDSSLILTHVIPDSSASRSRVLTPAMILKEVNGQKVTTLKEFRDSIEKGLPTGFLTIKTAGKSFVALSLNKIFAEEPKLSAHYFYTISPFVRKLMEKIGQMG